MCDVRGEGALGLGRAAEKVPLECVIGNLVVSSGHGTTKGAG